jgi:hypothetical protein
VISRALLLFFPCNHIINIKNKSFSGEAKDSVIFSFFILLHKRAKPIHPPYIHPSAYLSTHTSTPSLVRRRILLPCFANAKPLPEAGNNNYLGSECDHLPEAGNNNYLGSECDHLPEAGNIYIGIHSSTHPSVLIVHSAYSEGRQPIPTISSLKELHRPQLISRDHTLPHQRPQTSTTSTDSSKLLEQRKQRRRLPTNSDTTSPVCFCGHRYCGTNTRLSYCEFCLYFEPSRRTGERKTKLATYNEPITETPRHHAKF